MASVAGVVAGFVAGCGGSSDADPLNTAQFVQEANSICASAEAERNEALRDAADGEPGLAELANEALPSVEEMTEELGELGAPVSDRSEVQAIVNAFNAGIEEVKVNPANPAIAIAAFSEANKLAEAYGLTECVV